MIRPLKNTFLAVLTVVALGACQSTASGGGAEVSTVNTTCPIMSDNDVDSSVTVTHDGQAVGFCCKKCIGKWEGWDDAKKSEYVSKAMK